MKKNAFLADFEHPKIGSLGGDFATDSSRNGLYNVAQIQLRRAIVNKYERRRKTAKGINLIEEVVADVLDEARDNNEGELTSTEVKKRAGCPESGR